MDHIASNETTDPNAASQTQRRYEAERAKRLRNDGMKQFIDLSLSARHDRFVEDPWVNPTTVQEIGSKFPNNRTEVLIVGAGWGGVLYAVRMIQAGISPEDIRIVDMAGDFGGTWYWNRYPGLMCDIESYSYLPLLEETGFVPKTRYSMGEEIRKYVNLVVRKWGVANCGVFQTKAQRMTWNEDLKEWQVDLLQRRKGESPRSLEVRSSFVAIAPGVFNNPKLPDIPGILDYKGETFHSSRWDYEVTGGSPSDPSLVKLRDKRVAIIGTGTTSAQIVPHLARWSKHLYVVQRTPGAVDTRGQRETDENWFHQEVARSPGWQRERNRNFHQHVETGEKPEINLVDDGWTRAPGMAALHGNANCPKTLEEIPVYVQMLHELDLPRQNRIRARVEEQVKDLGTAAKLKAWYPTWCKRPIFHDEYLETFNRDNITLLDTDGKGLDHITADSIIIGNESYPVDVIVFATGYRAPAAGTQAEKANMTVIGSNGISMSEEWASTGPSTLHGLIDVNFPNLFLSGVAQAALSGNFCFNLDEFSKHVAYLLAESKRKVDGRKFAIRPTIEAAEIWSTHIMMHAGALSALFGCTPGSLNLEGEMDRIPPEHQALAARSCYLGSGAESYATILESWRAEGSMKGIEILI